MPDTFAETDDEPQATVGESLRLTLKESNIIQRAVRSSRGSSHAHTSAAYISAGRRNWPTTQDRSARERSWELEKVEQVENARQFHSQVFTQ